MNSFASPFSFVFPIRCAHLAGTVRQYSGGESVLPHRADSRATREFFPEQLGTDAHDGGTAHLVRCPRKQATPEEGVEDDDDEEDDVDEGAVDDVGAGDPAKLDSGPSLARRKEVQKL
jgi:hypothetical protein